MWYIILAVITAIYLILNFLMTSTGTLQSYIIRPLLWIILAIITIVVSREEGLNILKFKKVRKWYLGKTPIQAGLLLGGFQVSLLIIVGLLTKFGRSVSVDGLQDRARARATPLPPWRPALRARSRRSSTSPRPVDDLRPRSRNCRRLCTR